MAAVECPCLVNAWLLTRYMLPAGTNVLLVWAHDTASTDRQHALHCTRASAACWLGLRWLCWTEDSQPQWLAISRVVDRCDAYDLLSMAKALPPSLLDVLKCGEALHGVLQNHFTFPTALVFADGASFCMMCAWLWFASLVPHGRDANRRHALRPYLWLRYCGVAGRVLLVCLWSDCCSIAAMRMWSLTACAHWGLLHTQCFQQEPPAASAAFAGCLALCCDTVQLHVAHVSNRSPDHAQ